MSFDEVIKFRIPKKLKARLERIANFKGKKLSEVSREALLSYADSESKSPEKRIRAVA